MSFADVRARVESQVVEAADVTAFTPTCLVCATDLVRWEAWLLCPDCRYYYPVEMIAEADPIDWRAIQVGGFACTRCPQALPNVPRVHIGDDGLPMYCPVPPAVKVGIKTTPHYWPWLRLRDWLHDQRRRIGAAVTYYREDT